MIDKDLLEYIWLFREKAEKGRLVVFAGAGVSRNVDGMPDWNTLIQKMAAAIGYSRCVSCKRKREGCEERCLLKNDYSTDEFLKIPQYVFNKDQEQYKQILKENISAAKIDAPLSSVIFDINPAHIITTNYDHLIEASSNILCEQYQIVVYDKDLLNAEKGKYIIKMHGDIQGILGSRQAVSGLCRHRDGVLCRARRRFHGGWIYPAEQLCPGACRRGEERTHLPGQPPDEGNAAAAGEALDAGASRR